MSSRSLALRFLQFFQKRGHHAVPSASLIPPNDPTVLFTTAGMQQFKPYFLGAQDPEKDFGSTRVTSVQRCFRTSDIERVGDGTHLTFFEMLGNFSFGDYFKKDAIAFAWEFLTRAVGLPADRIRITIFAGDDAAPRDTEAERLWQRFVPKSSIHAFDRTENWWGPIGPTGPMGPCSELHFDHTQKPCAKEDRCIPNCECGRWVEIWNLVFIQFEKRANGQVTTLPKGQIDTGMGLERLAMVTQGAQTVYETDRYAHIFAVLDQVERVTTVESSDERERRRRIVADHWKGVVFLLADGVTFSNKAQGSVLRRLARKSVDLLVDPHPHLERLTHAVVETYRDGYPELTKVAPGIIAAIQREVVEYERHLNSDLKKVMFKYFKKVRPGATHEEFREASTRAISPEATYDYITTYGFSEEQLRARGFSFDSKKVRELMDKHREKSRVGAKKKFGGHGLNDPNVPESTRTVMTRMHTATHLLHQALRAVLGPSVTQAGSDITADRFRFDFTFPRKLTPDELRRVEELVNAKVAEDLPVTFESMPLEQAKKTGALAFFREKYPPTVTVYSIGRSNDGTLFSREICGGPHVHHTVEIGRVKLLKEEASAAGVRRIRAVVEPGGNLP
jgi:alanyl-tRNA synthetase